MMMDLEYRVEKPQYLRMTLEDCSMCMKNFTDPILTSTASLDTHLDEVEELIELQQHQHRGMPGLELANQPWTTQDAVKALADSIYYNTVSGSGKIQSPKIEQWLSDNFTEQQDVSIARSEMYAYYCECCHFHGDTPGNQASFGKLVRIVFPRVKTRRIGVRGHSRYHYFGIGPSKKNGPIVAATPHRSLMRQDDADDFHHITSELKEKSSQSRPEGYSETEHYLTDFPTIQTMSVKLKYRVLAHEFLKLYKDHAVRVIHAVVNTEFQKVKDILYTFWTSLPELLYPVLNHSDFLSLIEQCDLFLYCLLNDVLVPIVPAVTGKRITEEIKEFIHSIPQWLTDSLVLYPQSLLERKISVYQDFKHCILKQLQINAIYTVVSVILQNQGLTYMLLKDWNKLDRDEVIGRFAAVVPQVDRAGLDLFMNKVQDILSNHSNIPEELTTLVQNILQEYWHSMEQGKPEIQSLVLHWSYVSGQIIQLISDTKSSVTGLFLLLDVLCRDYLLFLIEGQVEI